MEFLRVFNGAFRNIPVISQVKDGFLYLSVTINGMVLLILRISGNRSSTSVSGDFTSCCILIALESRLILLISSFRRKLINAVEDTTMAITKVVITTKMIQLFSLVNIDFLKVIYFKTVRIFCSSALPLPW